AVAGLFGFPVAHENDPERAVAAALEIVEQMQASDLGLEVRVGVNTGEAFVRAEVVRGEGFATGDVLNTASRLQTAAPSMGVLVGARPRDAVRAEEFAQLPPLLLKGKGQPVTAWRLVGKITVAREGLATLVGRGRELDRLRALVAGVVAGTGAVALVEGEA